MAGACPSFGSSFRLAVLVAVAVLALAGCGDDGAGDGSTQSSPAERPDRGGGPSKQRYIAAGDGICRDAVREIGRLGERFGENIASSGAATPVEATTEVLFVPGLEIRERQADRLLELDRPAGDATDLDAYLDLFAPIEELIRQRIDAGRVGNPEEARQLENLIGELAAEQGQAARDFGLHDCDYDFTTAIFSRGAGSE